MRFEAYGNHLIVEVTELGNKTKSGILLGDVYGKGVLSSVKIVSIGSGVEDKDLKIGDELIVTKTSMLNIDYMTEGDKTFAVIEPKVIMARVYEDATDTNGD